MPWVHACVESDTWGEVGEVGAKSSESVLISTSIGNRFTYSAWTWTIHSQAGMWSPQARGHWIWRSSATWPSRRASLARVEEGCWWTSGAIERSEKTHNKEHQKQSTPLEADMEPQDHWVEERESLQGQPSTVFQQEVLTI